jgi:hypothetical protein
LFSLPLFICCFLYHYLSPSPYFYCLPFSRLWPTQFCV